MNPQWFGDSFDIVKRYFVENLRAIGYHVVVDPMLTGEWNGLEQKFYHLLGASPLGESSSNKSALLLDPNIGIGRRKTKQHVTIPLLFVQALQTKQISPSTVADRPGRAKNAKLTELKSQE